MEGGWGFVHLSGVARGFSLLQARHHKKGTEVILARGVCFKMKGGFFVSRSRVYQCEASIMIIMISLSQFERAPTGKKYHVVRKERPHPTLSHVQLGPSKVNPVSRSETTISRFGCSCRRLFMRCSSNP